jgi:3-dehydroquinate dehydratase
MSVLVIQGPRALPGQSALPATLLEGLALKIRAIGSIMEVVRCGSAAGLAQCLRQARRNSVEMVLVDSGGIDALDCARHEGEIRQALNSLEAPYIEIHERSGCDLETRVRPTHAATTIVVATRGLASGYSIAVGIVLRRLARRQVAAFPDPLEA